MKISIKNYKTIENGEYEFQNNEINYVLGANESGKTNLFLALKMLDRDKNFTLDPEQDRTKKGLKKNDLTIKISFSSDGAVNEITESGEKKWFNVESPNNKKRLDFLAKLKSEYGLNDEASQSELEIWNKIIGGGEFINDKIKKPIFEKNGLSDEFDTLDQLEQKTIVQSPKVIFIEPIINAVKQIDRGYEVSKIDDENSEIHNIFKMFSNRKPKEFIDPNIFSTIDEYNLARQTHLNEVNENIKKYFSKFKHIEAFPVLVNSGGTHIKMSVESKKWEIDNPDENQRSLGFKSFFRMVMELKAFSNYSHDVLYIIDEPEQSLHPLLQEELLNEFKTNISQNNKLTILISTHSSYSLGRDGYNSYKNINLISREKNGLTKIHDKMSKDELNKKLVEIGKKSEFNQEDYLFKIIIDSVRLSIANQKGITLNELKYNNGEITYEEYMKNFFK